MTPVSAQRIPGVGTNADDIDFAVGELRKSRIAFITAINNLSEAQWRFKPAPDRWSIAECAEHLAISEEELLRMVRSASLEPLPDGMQLPGKQFDREVLKIYLNRETKAQAPDVLKPSGRWKDQESLRKDFWQLRNDTIRFAQTTTANLRDHGIMHSILKRPLDCVQWLLVISAHTERHTLQIEEVKKSAGYPK
jgi:hypothetical protein